MIWFLAEDDIHYKEENINKLKVDYDLDKIVLFHFFLLDFFEILNYLNT